MTTHDTTSIGKPGRQALLFMCHLYDETHLKLFRQLEQAFQPYGDAYFIFDATRGVPDEISALRHHVFTLQSLQSLGYTWLQDTLIPGHAHFPVLEFAKGHPDYTHYWVIEYDVRFTGPLRWFFAWANRQTADFLATHLNTQTSHPDWHWWPSYQHPRAGLTVHKLIRFFGPLYRISSRAVLLADAQLKLGFKGHQEVILPSLANAAGMKLMDLSTAGEFGKPGIWSWYTREAKDPKGLLKRSTMRFRPVLQSTGIRPLTFYHPIKPAA